MFQRAEGLESDFFDFFQRERQIGNYTLASDDVEIFDMESDSFKNITWIDMYEAAGSDEAAKKVYFGNNDSKILTRIGS